MTTRTVRRSAPERATAVSHRTIPSAESTNRNVRCDFLYRPRAVAGEGLAKWRHEFLCLRTAQRAVGKNPISEPDIRAAADEGIIALGEIARILGLLYGLSSAGPSGRKSIAVDS